MELSLRAYVWIRALLATTAANDEAGEGVISTAIAVLIMAALGALMWVGFQAIWGDAESRTADAVSSIGGP